MNITKSNKDKLFAEGSIRSTIFKLSMPLVISQLVNVLYNIVDRIYIGNMPVIGKDALAGLGVTFPIIMVVAAFASLFGMGGAPLSSIKLGEGKKKEANKIMMNGFIMLILIGIFLTVILMVYTKEILYIFGAKDVIIEYSISYLFYFSMGTVFVMLTLGLNPYITAQGFTKVAMISVIIGALFNIILDPIFIYIFDLGVKGAAIATVISQGASAVFILIFLNSKKPLLRISYKYMQLNPKIVLSILALGISPFIMNATESLVQITFNLKIKGYGGSDYITYMNIMTIMLSIMQVIMLPLIGITQGASPLISYNYGAGNMKRVKDAFRVLISITLTYSFTLYVLIFLFPTVFVRAFNNTDMHLLEVAPNILRIFFVGLSIMGIQLACQSTFMALRQPIISVLLAFLRKLILLIPLTIILPKFYGIKGVFYAEAGADLVAILTTTIVFLFTFNQILNNKIEELNTQILNH